MPDTPPSLSAVRILPVCCGLGGPPWAAESCAGAPEVLLAAGLPDALTAQGIVCRLSPALHPAGPSRIEALAALCRAVADAVDAARRAGELPLVLGGDHTIAAGTWRGASRSQAGQLGLLWLDAHLDAHTPEDSPSGNWHGMPLAALLGAGPDALTAIAGNGPSPRHVALVGARSFEPPELCQLYGHHVRVYGMSAINRKGIAAVAAEALDRVRQGSTAWGLSLDLDVLDPADAPGVSTAAAGGLRLSALAAALGGVGRDDRLAAIEVVEYNPERDKDGRTARNVLALLQALFR